ncbi:MAG: glycosyltransferase family 39 protein [Candidatus Binatia bacterium]
MAVAAIVLLAAALRLVALDSGWFGVDQARDIAWAERIASGAGHPATGPLMRNRFRLGSLYYEFWSIPARFADGPLAAYAFAALLGVVAVCLTWLLARRLAGPRAALVAAALLATSPVAVVDARIAWAPAALPAWSAVLLVVGTAFVRAPSRLRAATLLFVAAFGTQLHVAAAPLAFVAGLLVLWQARALGVGGLAIAAVAGALPLLPMVAALGEPVPHVAVASPTIDPREHRLGDLLLLVPRVVTGLSPAASPPLVRAWLPIESVVGGALLLAALVLLVRPPRGAEAAGVRLVAASFWAGVAAVLLLPAEAWYYYLDTTLVPGAVLLGVAAGALRGRALPLLLLATVAGRTALLAWWIHLAAGNGYVLANLDWLRLGGARPGEPDARARLLSVATKSAAADAIVRGAGIGPDRAWTDVHGSAFADLDTDNGYFLRRAALDPPPTSIDTPARHALVSYAGELPGTWLTGFAPPTVAGPLEIRAYTPTLDRASAALRDCTGALPETRAPEPLAYGDGERALPVWPCASPSVTVPAHGAGEGTVVRVLARVDGAARVLSVTSDPAGAPLAAEAPGAGAGVELSPGDGTVTVRLDVRGPARLDLYELHGLR